MKYTSLAAVLLLIAAVSIRFPFPIWLILTVSVVISFFLSYEKLRQEHMKRMLCFVFITLLAFIMPLPLPTSWSPAVRLALVIGVWGLVFSSIGHRASQNNDQ